MAKALFTCPECNRSVTKDVRKLEKIAFFGAAMHFNCKACGEELVTGRASDGMVVITKKLMDKVDAEKRMEQFDPCI